MKEYTMTVRVPEAYRRHVEILQGRMGKSSKSEVVRELIDRELSGLFSF